MKNRDNSKISLETCSEESSSVLGREIKDPFQVSGHRITTTVQVHLNEKWLLKRYYQLTKMNIIDLMDLDMICHPNSCAKIVYNEFCTRLIILISKIIEMHNPDHIILQGQSVFGGLELTKMMRYKLKKHIMIPVTLLS